MSMPKLVQMRALTAPDGVIIERKSELGNAWLPITAAQFMDQVYALGAGLIGEGVNPGDAIGLFAPTCYEWTLLDMAIQAIGAIVVPIYESDSASQIEWIFADSGARRVITKDRGQAAIATSVADVEAWVIDEGDIDRLIAAGLSSSAETERRMDRLRGGDIATIVYTSGTTGRPRGVPLTHMNLASSILQDLPFFPEAVREESVRLLLFLPMAHIYARTACYMVLIGHGRCGHVPNTRNLVDDMASFRPTTIGAVPRVLEKVYAAAKAKAAASGVKRRIFAWCEKVASARAERIRAGRDETIGNRVVYRLAHTLVFGKLEDMLGGQMRYVVSGGAPLAAHIEQFFTGMGVRIHQGYGLTEASGGIICNTETHRRLGAVGVPCPGAAAKIDDDGEVLLTGPGIFSGYHGETPHDPAYFTSDGWFRTGDLGHIDDDGFLFISGRKKELIVTAGGKNVQPALVEDNIRQHPLVSQVVAVGEGQPFIAALITLDPDALPVWLDNHKLPRMDQVAAARHPRVHQAIARAITRANAAVSRAESVRKFTILPGDFTEANGLLTPSLKVRRAQVNSQFADEIAALYAGDTGSGATHTDVPDAH
ncbi:long-chain fatty acid--CoA ligase [Nanchangia anserum]|uniref:Acyl-CoA synthetase n=2 Tax=Nanchangia anserum TaxID=2692125 RepID=A0A8I0KRS4_9ACTO|nr:long-chain fatty acid--CoA ligase [Nanchangia anserum]QOX82536.1 long-chain fatty acid--CoA ligase [Nanchangia anserum]